jgi:16S rRNA processing protein RimM
VDRGLVSIGRLGSPKGVRGDLKVHSHSGESAHFRKLREVELEALEGAAARAAAPGSAKEAPKRLRLKVLRVEGEGSSLTLAFEGYASPEAARVLTGMEILVPLEQAAPLRPGEWYISDLLGLALVSGGRRLARVRSVLEGGSEPWLEVEVESAAEGARPSAAAAPGKPAAGASPRVAIIPFRKEFVGEIDLAAGEIELLVPELLAPDDSERLLDE